MPLYYIKGYTIEIEDGFKIGCDEIFKKISQRKISILTSISGTEAVIEPTLVNETLGIISRMPFCIIKN